MWVLAPHVDHVDDRASPLARPPATWRAAGATAQGLERRARRGHHARARPLAGPARAPRRGRATSGPAPAGGPRRARRRPRPRPGRRPAPTPPPGCRPPWPRPPPGPSRGDGRRRAPRPAAGSGRPERRAGAVGHRTSAWPRRARRPAPPTPGSVAGGSRSTARPRPEGVLGQAVDRVAGTRGRPGRRRRGRGQAGHVPLGRRRAQERRRSARPAPRRPLGQVDQVGPGAAPGPPRQRPQLDPGRRLDADVDDPSADPAAARGRRGPGPRRAPGPRTCRGPGSRTSCRWRARREDAHDLPAGDPGL